MSFKQELVNIHQNTIKRCKAKIAKNQMSQDLRDELEAMIDDAQAALIRLAEAPEDVTIEQLKTELIEPMVKKVDSLAEKVDEVVNGKVKIVDTKNYLEKETTVHEYLKIVRNSPKREDFMANWKQHLEENGVVIEAKNGVTGTLPLPSAVIGKFTDNWERKANWLNRLYNTGAKLFHAPINTSDQDAATSVAKQHKPGNDKKEQIINIITKKLDAEYIYKLIYLNNKDIWMDDGKLIDYVIDELFTQWRYTVCKAILVGDGLDDLDDDKITSVEAIYNDKREMGDDYVTVVDRDENKQLLEQLVHLVDSLEDDGEEEKLLFVSKQTLTDLREFFMSQGGSVQYIPNNLIAEQMGVDEIITTKAIGSDVKAILLLPKRYATVGSIEPVLSSWEEHKANKQGYRVEIPFGGGLISYKSAAVLKNVPAA